MNGIDKESKNNILQSHQSHLTLFAEGYFDRREDFPVSPAIEDPTALLPILSSLPGVEAVESRIRFAATLIRDLDELPCLGIAVDPIRNPFLFNIKDSLVDGTWLEDDEAILIGSNLARDMDLKTGDTVTLRLITSLQGDSVYWNALDVTIRGIFDTQNPGIDRGAVFIPLSVARKALALGNRATEIAIKLSPGTDRQIGQIQTDLAQLAQTWPQRLEAFSWKELENSFLAVSAMKTKNSVLIILVMLLIASVGIVNTMLMAVMERTREIGVLAALGLRRREIMTLFILEGGFIGLLGAGFGCLLGGLAAGYLEVRGLSLEAFGEAMTRMSEAIYPVKGTFYADLRPGLVVMVFFFGTAISLLASVWPARKAARLDPIQALRHI
jgi:putative ABC transport system permease protein